MNGGSGSDPSPASGPRRLRLPVPASIVTGALASGKTTFIAGLLHSKPPGELWAVLVNEFGAAGLDAALLEGGAAGPAAAAAAQQPSQLLDAGGVHIRQLSGGCLCCALSSVTATAIAQLLRNVKPDRLLIEPSGLAHPAALLDMLQGGHLASALALQPVVCLVDATQFAGGAPTPAACLASKLLLDQVSIADVLVGSKADLCSPSTLAAFSRWAQQLFPPKALVATAAGGQLQGAPLSALLSWPAATERDASDCATQQAMLAPPPQQQRQQLPAHRVRRVPAGQPWLSSSSSSSSSSTQEAGEGGAAGDAAAALSEPLRKEVRDGSGTYAACGWIFPRDSVFSRERLQALLQALLPHVLRLKGVFRVAPKLWLAASAAPSPAEVAPAVAASTAARSAGAAAELPAGGCSSSSHGSSGGGGSGSGGEGARQHEPLQPAPVELREVAYRRDSRVEVILDTAAAAARAAAAAAAAAGAPGTACGAGAAGGGLESQLAAMSLASSSATSGDGTGWVATALGLGAAGDWSALEAALLATVEVQAP